MQVHIMEEQNKTAAKELEEEGDRLTKLAIENDKKRKAGLEDKPGAVKKAKDNSSELQAIQDYIDKAQALQEGGRQLEIQAEPATLSDAQETGPAIKSMATKAANDAFNLKCLAETFIGLAPLPCPRLVISSLAQARVFMPRVCHAL